MANKACVFLANIEEHTVIGYSPNADTYVRIGLIHIVSKLDLFVYLNISFRCSNRILVVLGMFYFLH